MGIPNTHLTQVDIKMHRKQASLPRERSPSVRWVLRKKMPYIMHAYNRADHLEWFDAHLWDKSSGASPVEGFDFELHYGQTLLLLFFINSQQFSVSKWRILVFTQKAHTNYNNKNLWTQTTTKKTNFRSHFDDFSKMKNLLSGGKWLIQQILSTCIGLFLIFRINKCEII